MNGWHLTLRSLCTQRGWSRSGSRGFCAGVHGVLGSPAAGVGGAQLWSRLSHQQRWSAAPSPSQSSLFRGKPSVLLDSQGFCDNLPANRGRSRVECTELVFQAALQGPNLC